MGAAEGPIHIVFTVDEGYAMPLATAICSIVTNASRERALSFHIFYNRLSWTARNRIASSVAALEHPRASIIWQEASIAELTHLRAVHSNYNSLNYLRLLVPDLLPAALEKVIYLDADVVVLGDIADLWDEPLGERALLAVRDRIGVVDSPMGLPNYQELGISAGAKYFNSGVLVFNLRRWRNEGLAARILSYLGEHSNELQWADQDGLNAVLFDDWGELEFRWNWQIVPDAKRALAAGCWGLELTEKSIVHFVTSAKPWLPGSRYPERRLFYHYLDMTAWRGWRVPILLDAKAALKRAIRTGLALIRIRRIGGPKIALGRGQT
jgi:lipopolysaccharide biosynthesis glycosyltransferase